MIQSQYKPGNLFGYESNYLFSPLSQLNADIQIISQRFGKFESSVIVQVNIFLFLDSNINPSQAIL